MADWKRMYTSASIMLDKYQNEIVPGLRKVIEDLEQNQVKVRCKNCKQWCRNSGITESPNGHCFCHDIETNGHDFCSYGERREGE